MNVEVLWRDSAKEHTLGSAGGGACDNSCEKELNMAKGNNAQGKDKKKAKAKAPAKTDKKAAPPKKK